MAVYIKFKSEKYCKSIPIDGYYVSVYTMKERIFESKNLGRGTDFDIVLTNASTNEEYLDENMLIPRNTSVLVHRIPGLPCAPIVIEPVNEQSKSQIENNQSYDIQTARNSSTAGYPEDVELDDFGPDMYVIPEAPASQLSKEEEDKRIKALVDTPVLDSQIKDSDGFGTYRGYERVGDRMMGGRGFGLHGTVLERKTPPPGYICHRCKVTGHFIKHCPTNGDPNFDIKRVNSPTGIPKSMLMATKDGSYALPSGAAAEMKLYEEAFAREMLALPTTHIFRDIPPEYHCPLCSKAMKDAAFTSKCCFQSFCDKCIRNYFISKKMCACGAKDVLADDIVPNMIVRDAISRLMEPINSSQEIVASTFQVQDMKSKSSEPSLNDKTSSATSNSKEVVTPPHADEVLKENESSAQLEEVVDSSDKMMLEKSETGKVSDVFEAIHDSVSVKEPAASQISAPLMDEKVQKKPILSDAGKENIKKKPCPSIPHASHYPGFLPYMGVQQGFMMNGFNNLAELGKGKGLINMGQHPQADLRMKRKIERQISSSNIQGGQLKAAVSKKRKMAPFSSSYAPFKEAQNATEAWA